MFVLQLESLPIVSQTMRFSCNLLQNRQHYIVNIWPGSRPDKLLVLAQLRDAAGRRHFLQATSKNDAASETSAQNIRG